MLHCDSHNSRSMLQQHHLGLGWATAVARECPQQHPALQRQQLLHNQFLPLGPNSSSSSKCSKLEVAHHISGNNLCSSSSSR
jgi:hypothetical protein